MLRRRAAAVAAVAAVAVTVGTELRAVRVRAPSALWSPRRRSGCPAAEGNAAAVAAAVADATAAAMAAVAGREPYDPSSKGADGCRQRHRQQHTELKEGYTEAPET